MVKNKENNGTIYKGICKGEKRYREMKGRRTYSINEEGERIQNMQNWG